MSAADPKHLPGCWRDRDACEPGCEVAAAERALDDVAAQLARRPSAMERAIERQVKLAARRGDRHARAMLGLCLECAGPVVDRRGEPMPTGAELCELCSAAAVDARGRL